MKFNKENRRKSIRYRIRRKIRGTAARPRISIYRSNRDIYAQVIDDVAGQTILAASSREKGIDVSLSKVEQAKQVGKILGERMQSNNVSAVVFDRGGYLYHGRVKALADGVREAGINL
ncbi:MAG: 50S ribosomal protein L18 [Saprospiraceae bacterium]|nr:50S ribosomal protein L18 [Saprospiraceae bacterium]